MDKGLQERVVLGSGGIKTADMMELKKQFIGIQILEE